MIIYRCDVCGAESTNKWFTVEVRSGNEHYASDLTFLGHACKDCQARLKEWFLPSPNKKEKA